MQIEQEFSIPVPVERAWEVLLDVERVAPCFPGASLSSVVGDTVSGRVKVKLGPVLLTYDGVAEFTEKDREAHRVAIDAHGTDTKGNGGAAAKVVAVLSAIDASSTRCSLVTDLNVTGRPAQFGRGLMVEIGNKILGQFSDNLAASLSSEGTDPSPAQADSATAPAGQVAHGGQVGTSTPQPPTITAAPPAAPATRVTATPDEVAPLDLLGAARGAALKRLVPVVIGLAAVIGVVTWLIVR